MLDDRSYMRPEFQPDGRLSLHLPLYLWLMISLIVAFCLQQIDIAYGHSGYLKLALDAEDLRRGHVWELLTFQFLHDGIWHILGNLIGIYFFGAYVEQRLGKLHFVLLYFLSGVAGGLLQCALSYVFPTHFFGYVVGASAGVFALIAAFALMDPGGDILMFFVLPIPAKYLLYIEFAIALFFTIVPSDPAIAHAAHLGGILFALAYMKWGLNLTRSFSEWRPFQRKIRSRKMIKAAAAGATFSKLRRRRDEELQNLPSEEFISKEVDPILEKISAHGIQSLTERERQILQAARAKMAKR